MMRSLTRQHICLLALLGNIQFGNGNVLPENVTDRALNSPAVSKSGFLFDRVSPKHSGIHFINPIKVDHKLRRLYSSGFGCGGVTAGDINGDGKTDLFLTSGANKNQLYLQEGNLQFKDATKTAGLQLGNPWSAGSSLADIDNDGDLDLYVCNYEAPNQLFLNNGKGFFTEVGKERGLDLLSASLMGYFCDYDLDGDLDLYVLCNRLYREGGRPKKPPFHMVGNKPEVLPEYRKYFGFELVMNKMHKIITIGRPDRLYKNNGRGFFTDVTAESGIADIHRGLSATWFDYDDDGYPDLFVANDMNDVDQFYRNNRDGTFSNVTQEIVPHTTWFSMGADIADINNDGRIDYFCVDMAGTTHFLEKTTMGVMGDRQWFVENNRPTQYMWNTLFLNTGTGRFLEAAYLSGLAKSDWSWAPKFADFDNDGWIDLFITNGMSRNFTHSDMPLDEKWLIGREEFDIYKKTPAKRDHNLVFRNDGNLHFTRMGKEWGLDHFGMSFAAALADLDQDGNPDLVVANQEEPVHIYRNTSDGNRISLNLIGQTTNRFGIGVKVDIETELGIQARYLNPYTGYLSSNEPVLHFGLGQSKLVEKLIIHWPGGPSQVLMNLPANRHYTIREAKAAAGPNRPPPVPDKPMFVGAKIESTKHQETKFDDYKRQPLLPYKHSQLGPGTAVGDIDGDGLEDLFFGGARGQKPSILIKQEQGGFKPLNSDALEKDKAHEDMGALILDFNGDGNLDLFVVSGGVECQPGDPVLKDRMYLNTGGGELVRASDKFFPSQKESGGIATACDFDRDGDLDLFVGSRVIPGKYPLSPKSYLYINNGKSFDLATDQVPGDFSKMGLVTSALWSDADNDGWTDLLVTVEWGPVRFFQNRKGHLVEGTKAAGLNKYLGWWNGIDGRDIDGDGDIDYAVTNLGLNTKYQITGEKPLEAYYGKFGNTGQERFVESLWEGNSQFPVRGKSCSTKAMPHLKEKFKNYVSFAKATLPQIYTNIGLSSAQHFMVNTLSSGIMVNNGEGKFSFIKLPRLAQVAPGFGVRLTEVNGDGYTDLYLVQNFFNNQHETGRMDGGLSQLLLGNENGKLEPVWPLDSGLVIPEDSKSLATTDLNKDGKVDFVITANNNHPSIYLNQSLDNSFGIRLQGTKGNPTAIGSRIIVEPENGPIQVAEVKAGGSYLSQSSSTIFFGTGKSASLKKISVRWPDGKKTIKESIKPLGLLLINR